MTHSLRTGEIWMNMAHLQIIYQKRLNFHCYDELPQGTVEDIYSFWNW